MRKERFFGWPAAGDDAPRRGARRPPGDDHARRRAGDPHLAPRDRRRRALLPRRPSARRPSRRPRRRGDRRGDGRVDPELLRRCRACLPGDDALSQRAGPRPARGRRRRGGKGARARRADGKYQPEAGTCRSIRPTRARPALRQAGGGDPVLRVRAADVDGKAKLAQNRSPEERVHLLEKLWERGLDGDRAPSSSCARPIPTRRRPRSCASNRSSCRRRCAARSMRATSTPRSICWRPNIGTTRSRASASPAPSPARRCSSVRASTASSSPARAPSPTASSTPGSTMSSSRRSGAAAASAKP